MRRLVRASTKSVSRRSNLQVSHSPPFYAMRCFAFLAALVLLSASCRQPTSNQSEETRFVAMNLAAHPDDEDGATMHYYRRAKGYDVHSVIFTRGEGGQNEIGPELYEALGAIRSEETERAARHLGTQVHFLNFNDFGYSKSAEESFALWGGRDSVTASLVRIIRQLQPDVIFTNHDTVTVGARRQHGHHQAVGLAAYDAFALAGDATYRPEQLQEPGVEAWQPRRLYLRHWGMPEKYQVAVPVGERDPATSESYAAGAAYAIGFHASQGMAQFAERVAGLRANYFSVLRSEDAAPEGEDLFAGLVPVPRAASTLTYLMDSGRIAPLDSNALALDDAIAVPGQSVEITWTAEEGARMVLSGAVDTVLTSSPAAIHIPADVQLTRPAKVYQYHRQRNHPPILYAVYQGARRTHAGYLPLHIAPPVFLEAASPVIRLHAGGNRVPFKVQVFDEDLTEVQIRIRVRGTQSAAPIFQGVQRQIAMPELMGEFSVSLPPQLPDGDYIVEAETSTGAGFSIAGRAFDVAVAPGLKVGVVKSYDNTLPAALEALGVEFVMLDSAALGSASYHKLHTIVVDIRSYLVRSDLRRHNEALMDWVRAGGHLVVNYHKTLEWNSEDGTSPAPLPLVLGRSRVTLEDAPVTVQDPSHPLMHWPNVIGPDAWDGWVQERGLYFPERWDERYETLFCMNDPGEAPHCGSTLIATVGRGSYIYTALGWYRQLKVHHRGAYAIFANMISLPLAEQDAP